MVYGFAIPTFNTFNISNPPSSPSAQRSRLQCLSSGLAKASYASQVEAVGAAAAELMNAWDLWSRGVSCVSSSNGCVRNVNGKLLDLRKVIGYSYTVFDDYMKHEIAQYNRTYSTT